LFGSFDKDVMTIMDKKLGRNNGWHQSKTFM
jgi:hypothetical protein